MSKVHSATGLTMGSNDLITFIEDMKIPVNYLPKDPQCLFKNTEEADMWRHMITTIQPAYKIKQIRKQLLLQKIRRYENGGEEPIEINNQKKSNNLKIKLNALKNDLSKTTDKLKHKLNAAKMLEVESDESKRIQEYTHIKKLAYQKKIAEIKQQIDKWKTNQNLIQLFTSKNVPSNTDLNEKLKDVCGKIKNTIGKDIIYQDINNILEPILFNAPKKDMLEWLHSFTDQTYSQLTNLNKDIDHDEEEYLISKAGLMNEESVAILSAEHIKLNINKVKNLYMIQKYNNDYVAYLNRLKDWQTATDDEISHLDTFFRYTLLMKKKEIVKDKIDKIKADTDGLSMYEFKNMELLELIKTFDIKLKALIQSIEQCDRILASTPKKLIDASWKNCEEVQCFQFYIENNPDIRISYKDDVQELDLFSNLDVLQTPSQNEHISSTYLGCPINRCCKVNKTSKVLGWEPVSKLIIKIMDDLKELNFYKQKNKAICNNSVSDFESEDVSLNTCQNKMKNIESIQSDINGKIKNVKDLIEFWAKNNLKNYISHHRLVKGKPYKYYEDLLLEYKKLL